MQRIETRKDELVEELHGTRVSDPYRWLEGDPDSPELRNWLTRQADRSTNYFTSIPIRNRLRNDFKRLFDRDSISVPTPKGTRYFFERRKASEDMAVLYVKEGLDSEPKKLIDPNTLSADKTTVLADWEPSRDGKFLVYALSYSGNDKSELRVMNVELGNDLPEIIEDTVYPSIDCWNADGTGFWYSRRDPEAPTTEAEAKFHQRIFFHSLGTDVARDALVWGQGFEKECMLSVSLSYDGKYLLGSVYGQEKGEEWSEVFVKDMRGTGEFVRVLERIPGSLYWGHIHRDRLYVATNHEAPRWKLMATDVEEALEGGAHFVDVIQESEDVLEEYAIVGDRLFITHLRNVHTVMREYTLEGQLVWEIPLPTMGSAGGFSREAEGKEIFYIFNSFAYAPTVYRLSLDTNEIRIIDTLTVTFNIDMLTTEQVWCTSKDGTRIPLFLVCRKDLKKNGDNPTMLYGYGGFDVSLTPSYMTTTIPFIENGGIFVIANLRGGGEFGKTWHEAGMKKNKQNVFDDFIAAAEFLIKEGYTRKERLAVNGGSNGGLLVAAVEVQRSDLVQAVVCQAPVTDMVRFHLHHGGRHWIPEYGDPEDPDMFQCLLSYSPYHCLKDNTAYPATLVTTSDGDDRVHPLHAYKFTARLQEANTSEHPILMRVEQKAGHSGSQSISRAIEEDADVWAFVFDQLGMLQSQS